MKDEGSISRWLDYNKLLLLFVLIVFISSFEYCFYFKVKKKKCYIETKWNLNYQMFFWSLKWVGTTLLYIRFKMGNFNGCVKLKFNNDISLRKIILSRSDLSAYMWSIYLHYLYNVWHRFFNGNLFYDRY